MNQWLEAMAPLAAAAAISTAAAVLSVFMVTRRWALLGEGIAHSAFGGVGLAWLAAVLWPGLDQQPLFVHGTVVVFCVGTALAIGYLQQSGRVASDAAIGIFLVGSLAFGFLARAIYRQARGLYPPEWETYLQGDLQAVGGGYGLAAVAVSAAVVVVVWLLGKEIVSYCFDPALAAASGVAAGLVHYLLILLVALTITVAVRLAGGVLVTGLLVLPGSTALVLSRRLRVVMALAVSVGLLAAVGGWAINRLWPFVPPGPAMVMLLFIQFAGAYVATAAGRRAAA